MRLGRRNGKIEHAREGPETKSRAGASQSYWTEMTKAFRATVFACQRKNSIAPKAAKEATKEREIAWCRQKNRIANGTGRDLNFRTEADEGTVTEQHGCLLSLPALPCLRLHHFSVRKKNTTFGTQLLVYVVTTTLVSTSRRSSLKKKWEELRFIGGVR